jgi:hypothetical protein
VASEFDDHATVVVLELLVKRLIVNQCRAAPDDRVALAEWTTMVSDYKEAVERFAFADGTRADVALNAVSGMVNVTAL